MAGRLPFAGAFRWEQDRIRRRSTNHPFLSLNGTSRYNSLHTHFFRLSASGLPYTADLSPSRIPGRPDTERRCTNAAVHVVLETPTVSRSTRLTILRADV